MSNSINTRITTTKLRQGFFPRLNFLDYSLLLFICLIILWFYSRSTLGINYQWNWSQAFEYVFTPQSNGNISYFFQGLIATLRLSIWGMCFGLLFGTLLGLARFSHMPMFKIPATIYILFIRNIPPLVFVFIFYFFISNQLIPLLGLEELLREHDGNIHAIQHMLFGSANLWENLLSGVICIGLLSSAYIAEIVRSGLEGIAQGQWEAAKTLGLSKWHAFRYVISPQVLTAISPALAGQAISLVKDSSIVSLISIQEMTFVGAEIANSSGLIFEIWLIVGAAYLCLCLLLSRIFAQIEKRSAKHLTVN